MTSKTERRRRKAKPQSAAVAANIWEDRAGKARPTPERLAKGSFVLRDTEDAGITVAVDEACTMLDRLHRAGRIDGDQLQGGHDFAALMERTRMVSRGRSCLDFSPVGHDDSEPTHAELRDQEERAKLYLRCRGPWIWAELRRVCCDGHNPRDMPSLLAGLDMCAEFWRKA